MSVETSAKQQKNRTKLVLILLKDHSIPRQAGRYFEKRWCLEVKWPYRQQLTNRKQKNGPFVSNGGKDAVCPSVYLSDDRTPAPPSRREGAAFYQETLSKEWREIPREEQEGGRGRPGWGKIKGQGSDKDEETDKQSKKEKKGGGRGGRMKKERGGAGG